MAERFIIPETKELLLQQTVEAILINSKALAEVFQADQREEAELESLRQQELYTVTVVNASLFQNKHQSDNHFCLRTIYPDNLLF